MEIWKDVIGYEGLYQVSNLGNVKSIERIIVDTIGRHRVYPEIILNQFKSKKGYFFVSIYKNGKIKKAKSSRLVAFAFIQNQKRILIMLLIQG